MAETEFTENELLLIAALRKATAEICELKDRNMQLQAINNSHEAFEKQMKQAIVTVKGNDRKGKGKLVGDGLPQEMTNSAITARRGGPLGKEEVNKDIKVAWKEAQHEWDRKDAEIRKERGERLGTWKKEVGDWTSRKNNTKEGTFKDPKPLRPDVPKVLKKLVKKDWISRYEKQPEEGGDTVSEGSDISSKEP